MPTSTFQGHRLAERDRLEVNLDRELLDLPPTLQLAQKHTHLQVEKAVVSDCYLQKILANSNYFSRACQERKSISSDRLFEKSAHLQVDLRPPLLRHFFAQVSFYPRGFEQRLRTVRHLTAINRVASKAEGNGVSQSNVVVKQNGAE